jgi:cytochrome c oxidase assembly factor 2
MPDGTPKRRRRRRKCVDTEESKREPILMDGDDGILTLTRTPGLKRECPVPKPGGLVGEILGLKPSNNDADGKGKPP